MKMYLPSTYSIDPNAKKQLTFFKSKYGRALSNDIVKRFLDQQSNYRLFITAICFPTENNWENLDQSFRKFYIEIRFINYMAKVIWRCARDFRHKNQRNKEHYLFILDQPIQHKEETSTLTYKDQLEACNEKAPREEGSLLTQVEDLNLQEALKHLTEKQLKILDSYYVYNVTQKEIACYLGVSQQSVSKTIEKALDKLKDYYEVMMKKMPIG